MQAVLEKLVDGIIAAIPNLIIALLIFFGSLYLARFLSNLVQRILDQRKAPASVTNLLTQLTMWSIVVFGTIIALQRFFDVAAFLTGLGIVGFTVGFALQDIMKNFAAGVIILLQQPFNIGESIGVKGFEGTITAIDLRFTEMRSTDGRVILLPNADVLVNPIINYSRGNQRRVDILLNLPHTCDPDAVQRIFLDAIQGVTGFISHPEPAAVINKLTDFALELNASFWVDMEKNDPAVAKHAVLLKINSAFRDEGIEIPHPVQAVYSKT